MMREIDLARYREEAREWKYTKMWSLDWGLRIVRIATKNEADEGTNERQAFLHSASPEP